MVGEGIGTGQWSLSVHHSHSGSRQSDLLSFVIYHFSSSVDQSNERMQGNLYPDTDNPTNVGLTANYSRSIFLSMSDFF